MRYRSTRGAPAAGLDEALIRGIAPDGGLFLPEQIPGFALEQFDDAVSIADVAGVMLAPYFEHSTLRNDLQAIIGETFGFDIPVVELTTERGW